MGRAADRAEGESEMALLCGFGGHEADEDFLYHAGYHFGRCRRCGTDMVRLGGSWQDVTERERALLKSGLHLPNASRKPAPALPPVELARRPAHRYQSRRELPQAGARRTNQAAVPQPQSDRAYPVALAAVADAGMQLLRGLGGGLNRP
jgi:hypothetical protein